MASGAAADDGGGGGGGSSGSSGGVVATVANLKLMALRKKARARLLPRSLSEIDGEDRVVELRGYPKSILFEVGGRYGNVVTKTSTRDVRVSWRVVAVNGKPTPSSCVAEELSAAHRKCRKFTVTFRFGDRLPDEAVDAPEDNNDEASETARLAAEEAARRKQKAEEEARLMAEARAAAAAAAKAKAEEEARLKAEAEAAAAKAKAEEEARLKAEAEAAAAAAAAEEEEARLRAVAEAAAAAAALAARAREKDEARLMKAEEEAAVAAAKAEAEAEEARLRAEAEAAEAEAAAAEAERRAAEEKRRAAEEEAALEAARRQQEELAEKLRLAQEEQEEQQRRRQREEEEAAAAAAAEARKAKEEKAVAKAVAKVEKSTGLPSRDSVQDVNAVLLSALTKPKPSKEKEAKKKRKEEKKKRKEAEQEAKRQSTGPCDKCDGPHHTDFCPYFKGKEREKHKDATDEYNRRKKKKERAAAKAAKGSGGGGGGDDSDDSCSDSDSDEEMVVPRSKGRVVKQPGDGSCLFHSLSYGLGGGASARRLRAELEDHIAGHPDEDLNGTPIKDWVLWDSQMSVASYAAKMRDSNDWGGAIEIAVCARLRGVQVDVFEQSSGGGYTRISSFKNSDAAAGKKKPSKTVSVLYGGRCHYDALVVR